MTPYLDDSTTYDDWLTEAQLADRLAAHRAPGLMERTRATVCLMNARGMDDPRTQMIGFLSLFHPEMPRQDVLAFLHDCGL